VTVKVFFKPFERVGSTSKNDVVNFEHKRKTAIFNPKINNTNRFLDRLPLTASLNEFRWTQILITN